MFVESSLRVSDCLSRGTRWALLPLVATMALAAPSLALAQNDAGASLDSLRAVIGLYLSKTTAPTIATQPQSAVVNAGQPVTFTTTVTSSTTVSYQWLRNGVKITGATSARYVLPATVPGDSGAAFTVTVKNAAGSTTSTAARLTVNAIATQAATYNRLFNDQSPWNSRPTQYTLGNFVVPASWYFPLVAEGAYSTGVFAAAAGDPPMTVQGPTSGASLWLPDSETLVTQVVIPHWPAGVTPATGGDGHADIVDVPNNRIHSFYQLSQSNGIWHASQYSWTALDGRGFGTPAQYQQGARAAGVPPSAGLIRKSEVNDGLPAYRHALAMSMTYTALASNPTMTFPATAADWDAAASNTGSIPEGALMMIPTSFDTSVIKDPRLLKIVKTLQSYGAYVVDRNDGTPFFIYVENGSNFNLMPSGWDNEIATELDLMRAALRQVTSTSAWVDAKGVAFTPATNLNLLSMRGSWFVLQGTDPGVFDTLQQAVIFPSNGVSTTQINATGRSMPSVWGAPQAGKSFTLTVKATGNAKLRLDLTTNGRVISSTGSLGDGATVTFNWPANGAIPWVYTMSGPQGGGSVSATLIQNGN